MLPSLQSAAAALQSTWSALVAIPWTDICQEQLREGTSAASKVAEVLQALDGMYEEADEARSTEGSIADPCSWVNLCRLASPYPGGNVMLEGVALHHLLLSAAILEIEGQLVPHVIEQVAAGCLPPPKGEDTTVLRDLTSLVAYLSGISETRPGSSKQYNTTPLRALKRNLPFQGSASSSLSALQLLHGIRQRLLLPFPTIPDPQEISTAESLRAIQLLFASFASNPRCAASAAEVGEWAVRLEASPSRCSAQVTTVTRNVDGSGPLDHLRLILPPEAENPAPISKAAQRLGSSQVATAVPMMVPLRSRDNEERFPGGFFGAVLSTLNRGGQKKFHAVDGSESQGLQHQETKGERTSGRELATPEESLAPKAPPHPKQAVERVTTNSKRKVDTSMVAAAAVAFHTKDSPSVGSSHWLYEQAVSKWRDGSLARARFFFQEALEACQPQPSRKRGEEDVDAGKGVAAAARAGLVAVLASMGDIRAASSHLNALQAEQHNGHLPSAEARAALASRCHLDGNLEAAQAHYESALTSMVSILGRGHHTTLRIRCGLAGVQARLGDFEAAWQGYRRGASGMEAVLGASHPDVLAAKCSLAGLLQDAGEQAAVCPPPCPTVCWLGGQRDIASGRKLMSTPTRMQRGPVHSIRF